MEFSELPPTIRKKKNNSSNILWLYENQFIFISPENIVASQEILFDDDDEYNNNHNNNQNYVIKEILYKKPGKEETWATRDINLRHFLPVEYIREPNNRKNLPVKKIFWTSILMTSGHIVRFIIH